MNTTAVPRDEMRADLLYALDPDLTYGDGDLASALDGVAEYAGRLRAAIQSGDLSAAVDAAHGLRGEAQDVASCAVWLADTAAALAEGDSRALAALA